MLENHWHADAGGLHSAWRDCLPDSRVSQPPGLLFIDWRAARRAPRACCCPARPVVIAVIPPGPGRPHAADLLLCGHHYRVSRRALATVDATVIDLDGAPVAEGACPLEPATA
jgi:hypothetical protein